MKTNTQRFLSKIIAALLMPAILSWPPAQAADTVQWTDLPKKIGHGTKWSYETGGWRYRVVSKDGSTYIGYRLILGIAAVRLSESGPLILREEVAEIRIHRNGDWGRALFGPANAILEAFPNYLSVPVAVGATVGASPITLSIEGIKRLLPDKVIKVAP